MEKKRKKEMKKAQKLAKQGDPGQLEGRTVQGSSTLPLPEQGSSQGGTQV